MRIQPIVCFPINMVLVLVSTFCPLVSTVYLFFIKYSNVVIGKLFYKGILCIIAKVKKSERCNNGNEETSSSNGGNKNKLFNFILQFFSHAFTITYLILTYMLSFNIFFYGISYVIQFFIFTLLLAVPHFPIQFYIYIIFFTSVVIYISRFVYQFITLYRKFIRKNS